LAEFSLFKEEVRRAWRDLRGAELSPARGAAAVAIGLFIGSQPIFGCHTPLVLFLCLWFRLDAAICWVAANISNPFFAPALLTAEAQVGGLVRTGELICVDLEAAKPGGIGPLKSFLTCMDHELTTLGTWGFTKTFAGDLFLGALFVGLALAVVGGGLTFAGIGLKRRLSPGAKRPPYKLPENAPPWVKAVERVAARYAPQSEESATPAQKTRFHYVRFKLLGDPIARLIADIEGTDDGVLGEVLDIGTGAGQLPLLLLELGRATKVRGVDWDEAKIEDAKKAAQGGSRGDAEARDAEFERADAREAEHEPADTVMLIDLLHYFRIEEQNAILRRAAAAVRPGGRILVREADTEQGWRSAVTRVEEAIFTTLRFNRGERVRFRPSSEIVGILKELGFSCRVVPAWGKTPFSNVLVVGRKPREV
jgi:2-polyprenyl-3-methyl-5-hydroxy-6-metoxy-1,4-benzoquinol methylase/uncharacterized protein (DUF2062 family)